MDKGNINNNKDNKNADRTFYENNKSKGNNFNKGKIIKNKIGDEEIDDAWNKKSQNSDINQSKVDINNNLELKQIGKEKKSLKIAVILITIFLILAVIALIILFVKKPWKKEKKNYKPINPLDSESENDSTSNNESDNNKSDKISNNESDNALNNDSDNTINNDSDKISNNESDNVSNNDSDNTSNKESDNTSNNESDNISNNDSDNTSNKESDNASNNDSKSDKISNNESNNPSNESDNILNNNEPENPSDKTLDQKTESILVENQQLKRIKINIKSIDNILVEGINKTISLYNTYIYDISEYKNYTEEMENNIIYNKKYTYSILLLKKCLNNEECEIETDTLRNLENSEEEISLCLFNITNNNIILSIKCPMYFSEGQISEIISVLQLNNLIDFLNIKENININLENKKGSCGYNCIYEAYIINNNDNSKYGVYWKNKTISNKNGYRKKKELHINYSVIDKNETFFKGAIKKINFDNIEKININEIVQNTNNENDEDNYNETTLYNEEKLDFKINLKNRIDIKDGYLKAYLILEINELEKNIDYLSQSLELNEIQEYKSEINEIANLK